MDLNKLRYDLALVCTQVSLLSDKSENNYDFDMNELSTNAVGAFGEAYKVLNSHSDEFLKALINK